MDENKPQKERDFADHQAEVAGVPNGRMARFLTGESSPRNRQATERAARERSFQTQLDILMMDPVYAAAFERATEAVDTAQDRLNAAMENVADRIEHLQDVAADMEQRTTKLPDGTAVFRDAEGRLRVSDGRHLSETETASLLNPENLLSYEQYHGVQGALQGARARQDRLSGIQGDIDHARGRLSDRENPPDHDELDKIEDGMRKATDEIDATASVRQVFGSAAVGANANMDEDPSFKIDALVP